MIGSFFSMFTLKLFHARFAEFSNGCLFFRNENASIKFLNLEVNNAGDLCWINRYNILSYFFCVFHFLIRTVKLKMQK